MKNIILLFFISFVLMVSCSKDDLPKDNDTQINDKAAMIVGYLPYYQFALSDKIEYCKLTHLNLAFANPDSHGNIIMESVTEIVSDAKKANPKIIICISLAGGALTNEQATNWSNLIDISANRPAFIANIINYVINNNLDGVDVDLEWNHVTSGYSDFVIELGAGLKTQGKLITAAFPQARYSNVTDAALEVFDVINIMSYDATGPWLPSFPGQHSSLNFSKVGISFWNNTVGIPAERLTLGVPFYGYNFVNSTTAHSVTYNQMVRDDINNAALDQVGTTFYNGILTIKYKVNLAYDRGIGGIMIWELGQDSFDEYSLLKTIHNEYTTLGVKTSGLCGNN
ncbi:glycosyl hydrolase family 18 protein [Wocania ichthyoenteri]|uniref:glycosyl hydrolase family 18 protein n=1 Tax=Wocania ichthyoenteri TaxID=1230531 RepID=UPI00053EBA56|nr:glycosyl hydrolase family 18 protein [Wocania ichthyoenteri]